MQKRYELFEQEHQGSYEERRLEEDRQLEEEAELTDETDTDDEEDSEDGDELEDEEERAVKWNVRFQKFFLKMQSSFRFLVNMFGVLECFPRDLQLQY